MSDIIKTQHSFAKKAMCVPKHKFEKLYRLICQEQWITTALHSVLANKGSKTAGIDRITRNELTSKQAKQALIHEIRQELKERKFKPSPVKRIYIPKSNGKKRPLGIATLKDRVVQMLIKMVLEPIFESDFLNCSNGFRPGRRTMDCIARLDSYINKRNKFFWVIEGDIKGAFDNIQSQLLMKFLSERIADSRILSLINNFLKAGIMQGKLFHKSEMGVPQGSICSPLLANIYLHRLDLYWWNKYGNLHRKEKERRRSNHKGNCALIRYADDWLLLTNGNKAEAYRLREEFEEFLKKELKLELSLEKTHVTHVNKGFDFLGFHIRRYTSSNDQPKMLVMPSKSNQNRFKTKIKEMTKRKRFRDLPLLKFSALNSVLRGWINYYQHCNAKKTAKDLDYWVNDRLFLWLKKRHKLCGRRIIKLYRRRENGTRDNWAIKNGEDLLFLYRMSDKPITKYRSRKPENPYLKHVEIVESSKDVPLPDYIWLGNAQNNEIWREVKALVKSKKGAKCELCGNSDLLQLHHVKAKCHGGQDTEENAQLLCFECHIQTPTFGRQKLQ